MQIKKICAFCGNEYVADRKNAKYCSDKCRQESIKAHRREETARRKSEMTEKANTQEKCDSCFYQSASENTNMVAPEFYRPEWENDNYCGEEIPYRFIGAGEQK